MICKKCGKKAIKTDKYCGYCGEKLTPQQPSYNYLGGENMKKEDILICNNKGHFMLFIEIDDDDIEPLALYHEE